MFVSNLLFAQEVRIQKSTAEYYLEVEDKYKLLQLKDSLQQNIIRIEIEKSANKDSLLNTYKTTDALKDSMIETKSQENTLLHKEIRKQKTLKWGAVGLALLILIL